MRSLGLSFVGGVLTVALLTAAPSTASAQRFHSLPATVHPAVASAGSRGTVSATSNYGPRLGVQPSAYVGVATTYPYNPRTGTFSAVGVNSGFAVPTNAIGYRPYNYFQLARTEAFLNYRLNPYGLYSSPFYNPYLGYNNPYLGYNNPYLGYYNPYPMPYAPYTMYASGYGGYGGGGAVNPYLSYMTAPSQPVATVAYPSPPPPPPAAPAFNRTVDVGIYDNRFEPVSVTVSVGTTVRWTNYSNDKHSVTSDAGLWDSKGLNPSATTSYTFTQPGKYTYHSSLNNKVSGTIIVQ